MCSFIIPQITHVHPLGVRCDLRTSSLTSSQLFPASDFEEVELMTVPPVATATDVDTIAAALLYAWIIIPLMGAGQ